jgi:hypothetical protein
MSKYRKSWTQAIEEVYLSEAFSMSSGNKRVVDAFYDKKTIKAHGDSILTTDGETLTKRGMGGQDIAKWVNGKIKIVAKMDVKSTEQIVRYMKKSIPSGVFEEVEPITEKDVAVPSSIENLKQIVKDKQNAVFMFKDGKVRVDLFSASALVQVYDALKPATKKKFEDMIKTKGGFVKSVDFAFSMAKK